jgi:hypothetical protein
MDADLDIAYAERTTQLHDARGALAEAVATLTGELHRQREEYDRLVEESRGSREHNQALETELQKLQAYAQMLQEQLTACRNMKVVRWTASPRRFVYGLRARRR